MSGINSISMDLLQKGLDAVWMRQQVISNNIANADTPGFKSKRVEFEGLLQKLLDRDYKNIDSLKSEIDKTEPVVEENSNTSAREDGNNVVLDAENIELARAQIQYEYLVKSLTSQIERLKYAINGGR